MKIAQMGCKYTIAMINSRVRSSKAWNIPFFPYTETRLISPPPSCTTCLSQAHHNSLLQMHDQLQNTVSCYPRTPASCRPVNHTMLIDPFRADLFLLDPCPPCRKIAKRWTMSGSMSALIAEGVAAAAVGNGLYEHLQKSQAEDKVEELGCDSDGNNKKDHHIFGWNSHNQPSIMSPESWEVASYIASRRWLGFFRFYPEVA